MEFTKEEIETARKIWGEYCGETECNSFIKFCDSLLKPETKFINVRIEYKSPQGTPEHIGKLNRNDVYTALSRMNYDTHTDFVVTELPYEAWGWSDADMIEFAKIDHVRYCDIEPNLEKFKAERKPK